MILTKFEQKMMSNRLIQLKEYMNNSLKNKELHKYFNTLFSQELIELESMVMLEY